MALYAVSASSTKPLFCDLDPRLERAPPTELGPVGLCRPERVYRLLQAAQGEESLFRFYNNGPGRFFRQLEPSWRAFSTAAWHVRDGLDSRLL